MTEDPSGTNRQQDRDRRLAEALRANLRRRKAQAKTRRSEDGANNAGAAKTDSGGKDHRN